MRKKLLSLALCGVLLALAGCGQTESPDMSASEVDGSKLNDTMVIKPCSNKNLLEQGVFYCGGWCSMKKSQ